MELLAPAGDEECLEAAIAAGANAVYLGLHTLNARRGAKNFTVAELPRIVESAHARNIRIFLTLNIDVAQRELGQAVRMLKAAADARVDAILVRDPAIIHLRRFFPSLEFHFSTQTCIANSADVLAAGQLGASRVVLARELSLAEIAACSKAGPIETEVFVQGALCFCISGRCLLSSWAGGRSGNRGTCTSPCRVPWTANNEPLGTPLSMKDLTTVHRIADLQAAGVRSLKIEGRLKSARWVGQAVSLYAQALRGGDPQSLLEQAEQLGAYTGRQLTDDYLDAQRDHLVAESRGRLAEVSSPAPSVEPRQENAEVHNPYSLSIDVTDKGIVCTCRVDERETSWTLPRTVIHHARKAITIQKTLDWLKKVPIHEHLLDSATATSNSPDFLLVPRAANALPDRISQALRQLLKTEDDVVRLDLPEELRAVLAKPDRHPSNTRSLGDAPDRVRLEARHLADFVRKVKAAGRREVLPSAILVEHLTPDGIDKALAASAGIPLIAILPSVFFEADIVGITQLAAHAAAANMVVEVNNWAGWKIARDVGAVIEAGPGMGILNTLAATMLVANGCSGVNASVETDRKQLEDIAACPAPLSIVVFGRPALMVTRVKLSHEAVHGKTLRDRRDIKLNARLERGLWTLRPELPFDLRSLRNSGISAAHLVVDLIASPNPAQEYLFPPRAGEKTLRFNYGRTLA